MVGEELASWLDQGLDAYAQLKIHEDHQRKMDEAVRRGLDDSNLDSFIDKETASRQLLRQRAFGAGAVRVTVDHSTNLHRTYTNNAVALAEHDALVLPLYQFAEADGTRILSPLVSRVNRTLEMQVPAWWLIDWWDQQLARGEDGITPYDMVWDPRHEQPILEQAIIDSPANTQNWH